jgi:hypothetical protein
LSLPGDETVISFDKDLHALLCVMPSMPLQPRQTRQLEIPMNKIAIAFLAAASLASFGCKPKKAGGDMAGFEKHVDAICACKDQGCVDKENADYAKANPAPDNEAAKKMADDPKAKELGAKMAECMTKAMAGGAGGMAGSGSAAGAAAAPPAGGAAEPAAAAPPPAGGSDGSAAAPAAGEGSGSGSAK